MPRPVVVYGICGEGLGHASRAHALIERLEEDATVHILTSGDAHDFFKKMGHPHLHRIPGIRFVKKGQSINWPGSISQCFDFIWSGNRHLSRVANLWDTICPDLAVTDFEPLVPRVALRKRVPVVGIDNQSKISRCELKDLPPGLRVYQAMVTPLIDWMVPRQVPRVVSCFHPEYCRPYKPVLAVVGPLLRNAITNLRPRDDGFTLVYYKEVVGECLLRAAECLGMRTVVYGGCEHADRWPAFEFHPHGAGFAEALAACSILVCPAGNQLLGEAGYFGKKTLCMPQRGQYEQEINAFYMQKIGLGTALRNRSAPEREVAEFLKSRSPSPRPSAGVEDMAKRVFGMLAARRRGSAP
jgi:uncharacterized protein (TIGR00661 family)